jgi:arginase
MNVDKIHATATQLAPLVARAHANNCIALVIGGDCTVELGVVAGALQSTNDVGMIYIDFDADLNTPETTTDGALDWMGVAHMLGLDGTVEKLRSLGPHIPMLGMDQVCLFGAGNIKPHEQEVITSNKIKMFSATEVTDAPVAIGKAARNWASRFEKLVVHLDVDIIDFEDFPIAENVRRKQALRLDTVMTALSAILEAPNLTALTVCEINPDHSSPDGHDLATFGRKLAAALG